MNVTHYMWGYNGPTGRGNSSWILGDYNYSFSFLLPGIYELYLWTLNSTSGNMSNGSMSYRIGNTADIKAPEDCPTQGQCTGNGWYWYDDSCHREPKPYTNPQTTNKLPGDIKIGQWNINFFWIIAAGITIVLLIYWRKRKGGRVIPLVENESKQS
jgi:hypothetical protein